MSASASAATTAIPELVLYASLNCPFSALANYRASWLQATLRARVDVRLVCRPEDQEGREVVGDLRRRLDEDVAEVRGLLVEGPVFPIQVPPLLPDVREATWRYARLGSRGPHPRDPRVRLFRGLWLRGLDLSDPAVLDELGVAGPTAPDRARQWQTSWREFDDATLPLLVTSHGEVLRRLDALDELLSLRGGPTSAAAPDRSAC